LLVSERLVDLLAYVQHTVQLTERPVFSIRNHKNLLYFEHELQGRVGIHHDQKDEKGVAIWLKLDRLRRIDPPEVPSEIKNWVTVSRDPNQWPQVVETRMATIGEAEVEDLVEKGLVSKKDVSAALKQPVAGPKLFDVLLRLERQPQLRAAIESYVSGSWQKWVGEERPRRETIQIYENFFSLHQAIQSAGVEHPVEIVWGVGLALLKLEEQTIEQPLIEVLVELELDERNGAILVRPREIPVQIGLKPFYAVKNPGADTVQGGAREFFSRLEEGGNKDFSPFLRETFEPVLRLAALHLQEAAVYHPDDVTDKTDRTIPAASFNLRVTDTWVVYARRRSDNFIVEDMERLKKAVHETDVSHIPAAAQRFVSEPSDHPPSGGSRPGGVRADGNSSVCEEEDQTSTNELYFPKEFNEAQVAIIHRLDQSEGVVVQGPPGTGKTHTIANIICHYLATGRRVLVTSKGEPALEVLRDHLPPEIRDLSISLLTSEREGLRQLEATVQTLANTVSHMDPRTLEREIVDKEIRLKQLREKIVQSDTELSEWARKQLSPVEKSILGNLGILTPAELAQHVVENRERHAWFPDQLGPEPHFEPRFTDADIAAVREARKALRADLEYVQHSLPSPNDFPTAATVAALHEDIVNADGLRQRALQENAPLISFSVERALERTTETLDVLKETIEHRQAIAAKPWFDALFKRWYRSGFRSQDTKLFDSLIGELTSITERRGKFLKRSVLLSDFGSHQAVIKEAIGRAAQGKRPFGLWPIGKSRARFLFQQIEIAGQKPAGQDDWQHIASYLRYRVDVASLIARWNGTAEAFDLPVFGDKDINAAIRAFAESSRLIEQALLVVNTLGPKVRQELTALFPQGMKIESIILDGTVAAEAKRALELNLSLHRLSATRSQLDDIRSRLNSCSGGIVERINGFLTEEIGNSQVRTADVIEHWTNLITELQRIIALRPHLTTVAHVAQLVGESGAPQWAKALTTVQVEERDDPWTPADWFESWLWTRQAAYLRQIDGRNHLKELAEGRLQLDGDLKRALADLVKLRTYRALKTNMSERVESALIEFMALTRKIGGGIRGPRYRRDARRAMEKCYAAVPCWIMPTWRVSESLPATLGAFDLVIVDEASQSGIEALPALVRGKKLMIVGDDKQVSPTASFIEERQILQLRHNFLKGQPHASMMLPGSSLYDLANVIFPGRRVMLQEHFRCVEPIIRFSFQFYAEQIIPLRIPKPSERLDPPLVDVYLPHGSRNKQKINHAEAVAIVDEIEQLVNDPSYKGRSIGIVSLIGGEQAQYIQKLLIQHIGAEKLVEYRIACGDAATFQGKERDIMFVSMVASPGQAATQTSSTTQQRFNVALSRARDRMYLFRSVEEKNLNPKDMKAKVIAHFREPMKQVDRKAEDMLDLCESGFERQVFRYLIDQGYHVTPQVSVGPFRIDLVVEGANDRRLAVELDGDHVHGPERWAEDLVRQRVLERVGWRFWRCWYSSFTLDPEGCMRELIAVLQTRGIEPIGHSERQNIYTTHRVIEPPSSNEEGQDHGGTIEPPSEIVVEVEDRVVISYSDEPHRQRTVVISATKDDPAQGIFGLSHPFSVALLGRSIEEEFEVATDMGTRSVMILAIEKERIAEKPKPRPAGTEVQPVPSSPESMTTPQGTVGAVLQALVGRAHEVLRAEGRGHPGQGSFTLQERKAMREALGSDSRNWSDRKLAEAFLQSPQRQ
jgi:very-short-patch-repair endonuclease/Cdc6-like AAA superfamily ATPase